MRECIKITDRSSWLDERLNDITSTEISALYDVNKRLSKYELFYSKRDKVHIAIEDNERMQWGRALEDSIAQEASRRLGLEIEKFDVYIRDKEARIGSSFDYKILSSGNLKKPGRGILEIKLIDSSVFRDNWERDEYGNIAQAPLHIELQIQHQQEVAEEYDYTVLFALVGGNQGVMCIRDRDREIGHDIRLKSQQFWKDVEENKEPVLNLEEILAQAHSYDDLISIKDLMSSRSIGKDIEDTLHADKSLDGLILRYKMAKRERESMQFVEERLKTELIQKTELYRKVVSEHGTIHCKTRPETKGTLVTQEMVGSYINGRKSFREFRFFGGKE